MAKVKSLSSFNAYFHRNDASGSVRLEVGNDSSSNECKFIHRLLNEADKKLDKLHCEKDVLKVIELNEETPDSSNLLSIFDTISVSPIFEGTEARKHNHSLKIENLVHMAPITSCETSVGNEISLCDLAENHFNSDKMSPALEDTCYGLEYTLEDLLTDVSGTHDYSNPSTGDDLNLFGLSFSPNVDSPAYNFRAESKDEVIDEDLSLLLNSSPTEFTQRSNFARLADLTNSYILNNLDCDLNSSPSKPSNSCSLPYLPNSHILKNSGSDLVNNSCLNVNGINCLVPESDLSVSPECLLPTGNAVSLYLDLDFGSSKSLSKITANDDFRKSDTKAETNGDLSDDEGIPDIDLNICIKNIKNNQNANISSTSPASSDSGFDEPSFALLQSKPFDTIYTLNDTMFPSETEFDTALSNPRPSLFSKTISCKPTSDKMKNEKLKTIKRKLLKSLFPTTFVNCSKENPIKLDSVEDRSNHRISNVNGHFMFPN